MSPVALRQISSVKTASFMSRQWLLARSSAFFGVFACCCLLPFLVVMDSRTQLDSYVNRVANSLALLMIVSSLSRARQ